MCQNYLEFFQTSRILRTDHHLYFRSSSLLHWFEPFIATYQGGHYPRAKTCSGSDNRWSNGRFRRTVWCGYFRSRGPLVPDCLSKTATEIARPLGRRDQLFLVHFTLPILHGVPTLTLYRLFGTAKTSKKTKPLSTCEKCRWKEETVIPGKWSKFQVTAVDNAKITIIMVFFRSMASLTKF